MWWGLAVLAGVYFAAGKLGLRLAFEHASATAVWPPTGIALAAMLRYGYHVWPAIFVRAYLVNATTAAAAHEINNPLAAVIGQAQLLIDDVAAPRRRRIEEILEAAGRIQAIVARMKHLTRIEMMNGSSNLTPEMLDIGKSSERRSGETDTGGGSEGAVAGLRDPRPSNGRAASTSRSGGG